MDRIARKFADIRKTNRTALIGYLTAGDPDIKSSERNILAAVRAGLDILELGVPFSDPTADGPTIQAASMRALAAGITVEKVLALAGRLRRKTDVPIILFGYANPFFKFGYRRLFSIAADAGVDGFLIVDLPYEESGEVKSLMKKNNLAFINLIAPTTPPGRSAEILKDASGFVYYITVTGVTGRRDTVARDIRRNIAMLRKATGIPVAAGFGISNGRQARLAGKYADAVVVGSALVDAARHGRLTALVGELRRSLVSAAERT